MRVSTQLESLLTAFRPCFLRVCSLSEWIEQDECSGGDSMPDTPDVNDDADFELPGWSIAAADSTLILVWGFCAYLFNLGSRDAKREARALKDKRQPLLR